jgi:hypothetical protein
MLRGIAGAPLRALRSLLRPLEASNEHVVCLYVPNCEDVDASNPDALESAKAALLAQGVFAARIYYPRFCFDVREPGITARHIVETLARFGYHASPIEPERD